MNREIAAAGIGRKFQKPTVFEEHTVFDNLELAMAGDKRYSVCCLSDSPVAKERIEEVMALIGLSDHSAERVRSHGQTVVEIGMLLMQNPKLCLSMSL